MCSCEMRTFCRFIRYSCSEPRTVPGPRKTFSKYLCGKRGRKGRGRNSSRVETEESRVGREREKGRKGTCMGTDMGQIHSCGQAFRDGWVRPPKHTHTHTQMYPQIYIYTPTHPYTYAYHTEPLSSTLFWPRTPLPPPPHPCSTPLPRQGETLPQVLSLSGA